MQVVEDAWQIQVEGNSMWKFHLKLNNVCKKLSCWFKHTIGHFFDKTKELENRLQELEENFVMTILISIRRSTIMSMLNS